MRKFIACLMVLLMVGLAVPARADIVSQSCEDVYQCQGPCPFAGEVMHPTLCQCVPAAAVSAVSSQLPMNCMIIWNDRSSVPVTGVETFWFYAMTGVIAAIAAWMEWLPGCIESNPEHPEACGGEPLPTLP